MPVDTQRVRELLDYDPATGVFVWKRKSPEQCRRPSDAKRWNSRWAGKRADSVWQHPGSKYMCRRINVDGSRYYAHRLAWMIMTGELPPEIIDHINNDATSNDWANLRDGSVINCLSTSKHRDNTSGRTGVSWHKARGKWMAYGSNCGKRVYLGLYEMLDDAYSAAKRFRLSHGFDPEHGEKLAPYRHANGRSV